MSTTPKWDSESNLMKRSHFCNCTSLPRKLDSLERWNFLTLLESELEKFILETFLDHISIFPTSQKSKESIKNWESYGRNTENQKQGKCQTSCSSRTGRFRPLLACRSRDQPAPVLPLHPALKTLPVTGPPVTNQPAPVPLHPRPKNKLYFDL